MSGILALPQLGETMEEGRVVAWMIAPGAAYKRGDILLEVETDKTVVEVPALEDGELAEILAPEGAQVRVGAPLARLAGTIYSDGQVRPESGAAREPSSNTAPHVVAETSADAAPRTPNTALRATPLARRLARKAGVNLCDIPGTGRRNRVERADVELYLMGQGTTSAQEGAYALAGPVTGAPVLLLHGFGGDHTLWAGLSSGLVHAGCRVLAPDLPGHGANTRNAAQPGDLSNGLAELVARELDGPVHIVAHSLGAVPAVALAEAGAARTLTLIAPAGLGLGIDGAFLHGLAAARNAGEVAHLLERMTEMPLALSPEALEGIAATLDQGRLMTLAEALVGAAGQTISLRARLAQLAETLPVRIVAPHRDRILDWSDMTTVSPRIAIHHLPRAGHMAVWDAPQEVLEILRMVSKTSR